jgi:hypothetical protein
MIILGIWVLMFIFVCVLVAEYRNGLLSRYFGSNNIITQECAESGRTTIDTKSRFNRVEINKFDLSMNSDDNMNIGNLTNSSNMVALVAKPLKNRANTIQNDDPPTHN